MKVKMARGWCGRKKRYPNEGSAQVAVMTQMRYQHHSDDWNCFRVYLCEKCKGYHLTKGERR